MPKTQLLLAILLLFSQSCQDKNKVSKKEFEKISASNLIDWKVLEKYMGNPELKIIDLSSKEEYLANHLPGAVLVSRNDMEDPNASFEGIKASKTQMEKLLSKLGIKATDFIVLYDGKGNPDACRLFWILSLYGHKKMALLNGGFLTWNHYKKLNEQTIPKPKQTHYRFEKEENKTILASFEEVQKAIKDSNYCIIDTRTFEEFCGKEKKGEVKRAGNISSSIHIDYENNINKKAYFTFKTEEELKQLYKSIPLNKNIIVYCHSGVRSSLSFYVLKHILKYDKVKNYDGSWIEWSASSY